MTTPRTRFVRILTGAILVAALGLLDGSQAVAQPGASDAAGYWLTLGERRTPLRDYGYAWGVDGALDISSDFGLIIGIGPTYTSYAYRAAPYQHRSSLVASIAIPSWRYEIMYGLFMPSVGNRWAIQFKMGVSTARTIKFYGFGSDTPVDAEKDANDYYRIDSRVYGGFFFVGYGLTPDVWLGPVLAGNYLDLYESHDRLIDEVEAAQLGAGRLYGGTGLQLFHDIRERSLYPRSGTYVTVGGLNWFAFAGGRKPFQQIYADARWYVPTSLWKDMVLALRVNGMATFGEVPFYQTATLGGRKTLRGYEYQRYRGDHEVSASAELRFPFMKEIILLPIEFGGFLLGDIGRLWYEGESPGGIRGGWGLGIWGATLSRDVLGILYVAFSREGMELRAGFGFDY